MEKKIDKVKDIASEVMIDIIDDKFADNKTVEVGDLADFSSKMSLGVQLMVEEPIDFLEDCVEVGVDLVIGHVELMKNQLEFIKKARELQILPGLALDLKTGLEDLEEEALEKASEVLLMSVPAGFSGQEFDKKVLKKVRDLREYSRLRTSNIRALNIWVDGGVNEKTIKECVEAGANRLSVTSGIWDQKNVEQAYGKLTRMARLALHSQGK